MCCAEFFNSSWWWVWPVLMMAVCFFLMRRWRGPMMCGFGSHPKEWPQYNSSDSAADILDKRFAAGEIDEIKSATEYTEKIKGTIMNSPFCPIVGEREANPSLLIIKLGLINYVL